MSELMALARHGTSSPGLLDDLARHGDAEVQQAVAANRATPAATLDWLARRRTVSVRAAVAANNSRPLAVLERLAKAKESAVRCAVAEADGAPRSMLLVLMADVDADVRLAAARALTGPVDSDSRARGPRRDAHCYRGVDVDADVALDELASDADPGVRALLAGCLTIGGPAMRRLAGDGEASVRRLIAAHPLVAPTLLAALIRDDDPSVRVAAYANPQLPAKEAARAARSPDAAARVGAALYPLQDPAVLRTLSGDTELEIAATAVANRLLPLAAVWEVACAQPPSPATHKGAKMPFEPQGSLRDYAEDRLARELRGEHCACGARLEFKPFNYPGPALDHREPSTWSRDGTIHFLKAWCTGPCGRQWRYAPAARAAPFTHPDDALVDPVPANSRLDKLLGPWGALDFDETCGRAIAWGYRLPDKMPEPFHAALAVDTGRPVTWWHAGPPGSTRDYGHGLVMVSATRADAPRLYGRYGGDDFDTAYGGEPCWKSVRYGTDVFTSLTPDDDELAGLLMRWQDQQRERALQARLDARQASERERERLVAREARTSQALEMLGGPVLPPDGYEDCLGPFEAIVVDSYCGETTGWGHRLTQYMDRSRFEALRLHGELVCFGKGDWALVTRTLTPAVARQVHGPVTHVERGPRGGWRWARYGDTTFMSRELDPDR